LLLANSLNISFEYRESNPYFPFFLIITPYRTAIPWGIFQIRLSPALGSGLYKCRLAKPYLLNELNSAIFAPVTVPAILGLRRMNRFGIEEYSEDVLECNFDTVMEISFHGNRRFLLPYQYKYRRNKIQIRKTDFNFSCAFLRNGEWITFGYIQKISTRF